MARFPNLMSISYFRAGTPALIEKIVAADSGPSLFPPTGNRFSPRGALPKSLR